LSCAIELRGVSARYPGHRLEGARGGDGPLEDASLAVDAGDLVIVLGPNGAGKSTLLRVLAGTLAPAQGEALLFGAPLAGLDRREIARSVAVVRQSDEVSFGFSVRQVVAMGRAPHQGAWMREGDGDRAIVDRALSRCDLEGLAVRPVAELSGGEQKRVSIARALAQEPRVLLLDEPSAFLDVRHELDLYDRLADQVSREQLACVVVMHDLNIAAQYASRVVLMKRGRIVAQGKVEEVMTHARLKETFDADLYCGVNDLTGSRFFLPMRAGRS
jgi:iron complex transport system ATP-binding protein